MLEAIPSYEQDSHELFPIGEVTADDILTRFSHSLLDDTGEYLEEFYFGCNVDRIEWHDGDFSHQEIAPEVIMGISVEEMSEGRFAAVSPLGMNLLMFKGPHRKDFSEALKSALELERQRVADPCNSDDHLPRIRSELMKAKAAIFANCKAAG